MKMKRIWIFMSLVAVMVWTAGPALAQSGAASGQTPAAPETQAPPQSTAPTTPQNLTPVKPDAGVKAEAGVSAGAMVIMEKAKKAPAPEAEDTEKKLRETVRKVEEEAATNGDQTVASRLGAEFGMTPDALIAEKGTYKTGWGELMIAHTLLANVKSGAVTLDQLFEMRRNGLGWGQIGHGLDFKLSGVVSAVKAESRVAIGAVKADGRPAKIQSASAKANAGTKVGVGAGQKGAGVATDVGVGVDTAVKTQTGK
jgi:hypothetical protein